MAVVLFMSSSLNAKEVSGDITKIISHECNKWALQAVQEEVIATGESLSWLQWAFAFGEYYEMCESAGGSGSFGDTVVVGGYL